MLLSASVEGCFVKGEIHSVIQYQHSENACLLNFRTVTGLLDLGECLSLDANNLPSAAHISPVEEVLIKIFKDQVPLKIILKQVSLNIL